MVFASWVLGTICALFPVILWFRRRYPWTPILLRWLPKSARRTMKPGLQGAKDLEYLIRLLGDVYYWLGTNKTLLITQIRKTLWQQTTYATIEQTAYLAVFSSNESQKFWTRIQLSQYDIASTKQAIEGLERLNSLTDDERREASLVLLELMEKWGEKETPPTNQPNDATNSKNGMKIVVVNTNINANARDSYSANQAAAVGPNSTANHIIFSKSSSMGNNELTDLAAEIGMVRVEMKKNAVTAEDDCIIGDIASAETSARKGDGIALCDYLLKAGPLFRVWAEKVGANKTLEYLRLNNSSNTTET